MVVVGDDDDAGGDDAMELGRLLATTLAVDVLPVSVIVTGSSPRARSELERGGGRLVVAPSVARGLTDVANEVDARAVVVGSSRRGRIGRIAFGTGAEHLAKVAQCPVAIAPSGFARRYASRLRRVETSFDGSPGSAAALALAGMLASAEHGCVLIHAAREVRDTAEHALARLPRNVKYEIDVAATDDLERHASSATDVMILSRSSERTAREFASALILV